MRIDIVAFRLAQQSIAQLASMAENLRVDIHEENRVASEFCTRSESLADAGKLEIENALLADRILEKNFRIAKKVIVAEACQRFVAEDTMARVQLDDRLEEGRQRRTAHDLVQQRHANQGRRVGR